MYFDCSKNNRSINHRHVSQKSSESVKMVSSPHKWCCIKPTKEKDLLKILLKIKKIKQDDVGKRKVPSNFCPLPGNKLPDNDKSYCLTSQCHTIDC